MGAKVFRRTLSLIETVMDRHISGVSRYGAVVTQFVRLFLRHWYGRISWNYVLRSGCQIVDQIDYPKMQAGSWGLRKIRGMDI